MKSSRTPAAILDPSLSPQDRIRTLLAFSLCVDSVQDTDPLTLWSSLDLTEAVIVCERDLKIPEIEDERLLKCLTIEDLTEVILGSPQAPVG